MSKFHKNIEKANDAVIDSGLGCAIVLGIVFVIFVLVMAIFG